MTLEKLGRCQATTSAGTQCKCYATCLVNHLPFCDQHAVKVVREAFKPPIVRSEARTEGVPK